jgi:hypothetical protein
MENNASPDYLSTFIKILEYAKPLTPAMHLKTMLTCNIKWNFLLIRNMHKTPSNGGDHALEFSN